MGLRIILACLFVAAVTTEDEFEAPLISLPLYQAAGGAEASLGPQLASRVVPRGSGVAHSAAVAAARKDLEPGDVGGLGPELSSEVLPKPSSDEHITDKAESKDPKNEHVNRGQVSYSEPTDYAGDRLRTQWSLHFLVLVIVANILALFFIQQKLGFMCRPTRPQTLQKKAQNSLWSSWFGLRKSPQQGGAKDASRYV
mmetsp:Transcript_63778/g.134348  ORF Transcript_63778/g.134348 Transcript_63778/m.134348 type:complete len:198 (-) Transcript_63778:87-680(-)